MNKTKKEHVMVFSNAETNTHSYGLQLYFDVPEDTIKIITFRNLALERFERLMLFEAASNAGYERYSVNWIKYIQRNFEKKHRLSMLQTNEKEYIADHISHYALRFAFCNSKELWDWFINREIEWFYYKYKHLTVTDMKSFIVNYCNYEELSETEKEKIIDKLKLCYSQETLEEPFYKASFKDCFHLINARKIYLCKGIAYLPLFDLCFSIMSRFKTYMSKILHGMQKPIALKKIEPYSFIIQHIRNMISEELSTTDMSYVHEEINISDIDEYSNKHFPLCMKNLNENLVKNHHLKYGGRNQLGRFIKDIGISMEDALTFWKTEFLQKMSEKKFERDYAYHIKHTYGMVGRKKEYKPQTCHDIINDNVGPRECHGCPFKINNGSLLDKLREDNINREDINKIVKYAEEGAYRLACTEYFNSVHNRKTGSIINYPRQYFNESMRIRGGFLDLGYFS